MLELLLCLADVAQELPQTVLKAHVTYSADVAADASFQAPPIEPERPQYHDGIMKCGMKAEVVDGKLTLGLNELKVDDTQWRKRFARFNAEMQPSP